MKLAVSSIFFKSWIAVLACLMLSPTVQADSNKALERAQFMLRQLNAQKVELENKNAALTAKLGTLQKESAKQLKKQKAGNKKLSLSAEKKARYIEKLRDRLKQTKISLRKSEQLRLQANHTGQALDEEMKQCVSNNNSLVRMNDRLIDKYSKKGCWDSITQNEPFTGINQVEMENIIQEYRFTNEDYEIRLSTEYKQYGGEKSVVSQENKLIANKNYD